MPDDELLNDNSHDVTKMERGLQERLGLHTS